MECEDSCSLAPPAQKEKKHSDDEEENESEHETESIADGGLLSEDDVSLYTVIKEIFAIIKFSQNSRVLTS